MSPARGFGLLAAFARSVGKTARMKKMCHHDSEKSIIDAGHSVAEMVDI